MISKGLQLNGIMLIVLLSALFSCKSKNNSENQQNVALSVAVLKPANRQMNETFSATIRGNQDIDIRPQISGFITEVKVDEGALVHKGQVLFVVDPVQYQAAVNVAKANIAVAQANVETAKLTASNKHDLAKQNVISQYDYQVADNELKRCKSLLVQAQSQLISANKDLSHTRITSPTNGIIGKIPFRRGSLVNPSMAEAMTTVSENTTMYANFSITEKKLLLLSQQAHSAGDICRSMPKVQLKLADGSTYNELGKIETISGIIDQATGSVSVRASFPNKNRILRSGGTGAVLLPYKMNSCLVIPQNATYEIQDKKFAYTVDNKSTVHSVEIEVYPIDNGAEYIVTKGLAAGDRILVEGIASVKDGMTIKAKLN
jgi:RND family efflux transporter MFP subunit